MSPTLAAALAAAAAAWPALPPPDATFVAFARDRLDDDPAPADDLDDRPARTDDALAACPHLADLLIAFHAARGHPAAVAGLARLLEPLRGPLRRTGADAVAIDELLRDLPTDLIAPRDGAPPRLHGYAGRGPLAGWLRVVAVRAMVDRRRRAGAAPADDDTIAAIATPELDPELALLRRRHAAEFRAAFAWAVDGLAAEDRALLRQHHLDGLGLDHLARLHGVHRATAARRLAAARDAIFTRVRRRLLHDLRIGGETVDSILRLVHSELAVSLDRYL